MDETKGNAFSPLRSNQVQAVRLTVGETAQGRMYKRQSQKGRFITRRLASIFTPAVLALTSTIFCGAVHADGEESTEIQQDGTVNSAIIEQNNVTPETIAGIEQHGTSITGTIFQSDIASGTVSSYIVQIGSSNSAVNDQTNIGYDSEASVYQHGSANESNVLQADSSETSAIISQTGNVNALNITQFADSARAEVTQVGTLNDATVNQLGGSLSVTTIYQEGQFNVVSVSQEFDFTSVVNAEQMGTNNLLDIVQEGHTQDFGDSNINVSMDGNNNEIFVAQDFSFQYVDVVQSGNFNYMHIIENGIESRVNVTSLNSDNNTDIIISGNQANGFSATLERNGTDNSTTYLVGESGDGDVFVEQTNSLSVEAVTHQAVGPFEQADVSIRQIDSINAFASTTQEGVTGVATIKQTNGNLWSEANIQQYDGDNLIASIYQTNTSLTYADIDQTNEISSAVVKQFGTTSTDAYILQTGTSGYAGIMQSGIHNSASIAQAGDGYSAAIYQDGINNDAHISQH